MPRKKDSNDYVGQLIRESKTFIHKLRNSWFDDAKRKEDLDLEHAKAKGDQEFLRAYHARKKYGPGFWMGDIGE